MGACAILTEGPSNYIKVVDLNVSSKTHFESLSSPIFQSLALWLSHKNCTKDLNTQNQECFSTLLKERTPFMEFPLLMKKKLKPFMTVYCPTAPIMVVQVQVMLLLVM
jgi:hypothetical protein